MHTHKDRHATPGSGGVDPLADQHDKNVSLQGSQSSTGTDESSVGSSAPDDAMLLQQKAVAVTQLPNPVVQVDEQAAATGWLVKLTEFRVTVCLYAPATLRLPALMVHIMPVIIAPDGHCSRSGQQ